MKKRWSKEDTQYLIDNYIDGNKDQLKVLVSKLGRTAHSIRWRASKLGLTRDESYWSDKETEFLIKNLDYLTYQDIADQLGRTRPAVKNKIIGLKKNGIING